MATMGDKKGWKNSNKQNTHCNGCKYQMQIQESGNQKKFFGICGYILITGESRKCDAGKKVCTHYERKKRVTK